MSLQRKVHEIYSKDSTVYIIKRKIKRRCLKEAVDRSGFIDHLNAHWNAHYEESGIPKEAFPIAIKPNFMCTAYETDISVYTDVDLVEYLVELIRAEGYRDISIVESQMVWSLFRGGRTVHKVAEMVGYSGNGYKIVDLTETMQAHHYNDGILDDDYAGPAWKDAKYRISFAKNKTHFQCYYTGCMKNVYGCLPQSNKLLCYHHGLRGRDREFHTATIAMLEEFPVNFAFLDAYISGDGFAGLIRDSTPEATNTIICGENCFAVDWVQGEKMGLKPRKNYVVRRAAERWGEPGKDFKIIRNGAMMKWVPWRNVPSLIDTFANLFEEGYHFARFFCFMLSYRMDPQFPLVRDWACFFSTPFRKTVEFLDEYGGVIYPILVAKLIIIDLVLIIRWLCQTSCTGG